MKVARLYLRVSTEEQDLTRQNAIERSARAPWYYIAGNYREKRVGRDSYKFRRKLINPLISQKNLML